MAKKSNDNQNNDGPRKISLSQEMLVALRMFGLSSNAIVKISGGSRKQGTINKYLNPSHENMHELSDVNDLREKLSEYFFAFGMHQLFSKDMLQNIHYNLGNKQTEGMTVKQLVAGLYDFLEQEDDIDERNAYLISLNLLIHQLDKMRSIKHIHINTRNILKEMLSFPGIILAGDGKTRFFEESALRIQFDTIDWRFDAKSHTSSAMSLGKESLEYYAYMCCCTIGWMEFIKGINEHRQVWNGKNIRVFGVQYIGRDSEKDASLILNAQISTYVMNLGSHFGIVNNPALLTHFTSQESRLALHQQFSSLFENAYNKRLFKFQEDIDEIYAVLAFLKSEWPLSIEKDLHGYMTSSIRKTIHKPETLESGFMANLLSVNVTYITTDDYVLISKRGKNSGHMNNYRYQTSAAGFVSFNMDYRGAMIDYKPSIKKAIAAETAEETGYQFNKATIIEYDILGVVRDTVHYEIGIMATGILDISAANCAGNIINPAIEHCASEVDGFVLIPFRPKDVFTFILSEASNKAGKFEPWNDFVPLGGASLIFALAHRFDWDTLRYEWNNCRDQAR